MGSLEWDTRGLSAQDRFPFWHETMSQMLVSTWATSDDPDGFHAADPRRQTYLRLLTVVNGRPPPDDPTPALTWSDDAPCARFS
ncbi:hypothetical protein ACWEQG_33760 [Microbispora sp. NPDC004025]